MTLRDTVEKIERKLDAIVTILGAANEARKGEAIREYYSIDYPLVSRCEGGWSVEMLDGYYGPFATETEARELAKTL
jgi:hypothetical protein